VPLQIIAPVGFIVEALASEREGALRRDRMPMSRTTVTDKKHCCLRAQ